MNQRQAVTQVSEVAIWAREQASAASPKRKAHDVSREWIDLADAADDLAAMIERDTFRTTGG